MKKRFLALTLVCTFALSLAACGNKPDTNTQQSQAPSETSQNSEADTNEPSSAAVADTSSAVGVLTSIWNAYSEDLKFPCGGGDFSEENNVMGAPGVYSLEDAAAVDSALGYPAAAIDKIDSAASLTHMMNANTFTCGAYHLVNSDDANAVAEELKNNILGRQWMCGFPDKLVIVTMDEYVIAAFGEAEIMAEFENAVSAALPSATVFCAEDIL